MYVLYDAYISPISVPHIIKMRVIFQLFEFGKCLKNSDPPPPPVKASLHLKCRIFPQFVTFFVWNASLRGRFKTKNAIKCGKSPKGPKLKKSTF